MSTTLKTSISMTVAQKAGDRPWCARITGTDEQYGLAREFVRTSDRDMSRSGATGTLTYTVTEPGLYQIGGSRHDDRMVMVFVDEENGGLKARKIEMDRAKLIARLMSAGQTYEQARDATRPSKIGDLLAK